MAEICGGSKVLKAHMSPPPLPNRGYCDTGAAVTITASNMFIVLLCTANMKNKQNGCPSFCKMAFYCEITKHAAR